MMVTPLILHPHPNTPCPAVRALAVDWAWVDADILRLDYRLDANLAALRIPPRAAMPAARDGLWQHTCFEAFIAALDAPGYHEFNASPCGDFAAYVFAAERQRQMAVTLPAPQVSCQAADEGLQLRLEIPRPALPEGRAWQLGLSAVIESASGACSYFALAHPRPVPDFHARAGWTARLSL
ncbi:MAG: DOMON-like domain-containing protein [Pseudomonadota bacterium]|nr:DOMON-like domain-containing protein [Pseudomonadota bacterium]